MASVGPVELVTGSVTKIELLTKVEPVTAGGVLPPVRFRLTDADGRPVPDVTLQEANSDAKDFTKFPADAEGIVVAERIHVGEKSGQRTIFLRSGGALHELQVVVKPADAAKVILLKEPSDRFVADSALLVPPEVMVVDRFGNP
ncbi:MAG: hypothetical protein C0516_01750, partial [Gemmatimonas sp.]|nr:hypothetical protein [Gemmatimonas sp.]